MPISKTAGLDRGLARDLIENFSRDFLGWCRQTKPPTHKDLEKYLAQNFHLISNNQLQCKSLQDYINKMAELQKKYASLSIKFLDEPLVSGNRMTVYYNVDFGKQDGEKGVIQVMAIAAIEDNKVTNWTEVTHKKAQS